MPLKLTTSVKTPSAPKSAGAPPSYGLFTGTSSLSDQTIAGQSLPSTSGINSGLAVIDQMMGGLFKTIQTQQASTDKQSILLQKKQNKQDKANKSLLADLNAQLAANPNPSNVTPPPPSMSNQEVQQASDQVRIDAAKRMGQNKSLLAGNMMGGLGGTMSTATGLRSLLG